jgi:hypothetical protein
MHLDWLAVDALCQSRPTAQVRLGLAGRPLAMPPEIRPAAIRPSCSSRCDKASVAMSAYATRPKQQVSECFFLPSHERGSRFLGTAALLPRRVSWLRYRVGALRRSALRGFIGGSQPAAPSGD